MKTTNYSDVRYVLNEEKDLKEARSKIVLLLIDCSIVCTILYYCFSNCCMKAQSTVISITIAIFVSIELSLLGLYFALHVRWRGDYLIIDEGGVKISYPSVRVINGEYFDCRYFKSPYEFHFTKSLTPISWNHIESIEFRFATIPANINFYGDYIPVSLASKFELCLCVTAKNGDEVWTGINLTCWPLGGNSYLSEIRNIERAVYRFTGRTDLTVNRIRYSDMCYCLVPLASFQPYKK